MKLEPRVLENRFVRLEPVSEANREALRAALDVDPDTWNLMSKHGRGDAFANWWCDAVEDPKRIAHAVRRLSDGEVVGTTSYLNIRQGHGVVEIGWTFYRPDARGGPVNPACKRLLIGNAFEAGARRVELMVDARNLRSQAAVEKLGAVREGVIRRHMVTWTGHVRDTVVFAILDDEWPEVRRRLDERLATFA